MPTQAVFYFGGYHASDSDIDAWVRTAKMQKPNVDFTGYPWPKGANSDAKSAVKAFSKDGHLDAVVADIQGCADQIFIVGHSSGCAIANEVDANQEWTNNITLVALDGFTPSDDQLDRPSTQVWGAVCGHVHSRNYPGFSKGRRKIFHATNCKSEWALHFSMVNLSASDSLVQGVSTGYKACVANLLFM